MVALESWDSFNRDMDRTTLVAVRLMALAVQLLATWWLVGNLVFALLDFDLALFAHPVYFFATEILRPLVGLSLGAGLWAASRPIARLVEGL